MRNSQTHSFTAHVSFTLLAWLVTWPAYSYAAMITAYSTTIDSVQQDVAFSITFDSVPDFYTTDSYGRQADDFQYFIDSDGIVNYPYYDAIVSGANIATYGDITVQNPTPGDNTGPGGWGAVAGETPFTLTGTTVNFSVSWALLGNTDGNFIYALYAGSYGSGGQYLYGNTSGQSYTISSTPPAPIPTPLPSAAWLLGSGLLGLIGAAQRKTS